MTRVLTVPVREEVIEGLEEAIRETCPEADAEFGYGGLTTAHLLMALGNLGQSDPTLLGCLLNPEDYTDEDLKEFWEKHLKGGTHA